MKKRKAFTMFEMIMSMLILSALGGISILSLQGVNKSAILTSVRSDVINIITLIRVYDISSSDISDIEGTYEDQDNNGQSSKKVDSNVVLLSSGNVISVKSYDCPDAAFSSYNCFSVTGSNPELTDSNGNLRVVTFHSELHNKIKVMSMEEEAALSN